MFCVFIGHRKIKDSEELRKRMVELLESLVVDFKVNTFLFGSKSEFNDLCYFMVTELKKKYPYIKRIFYNCKSEYCILESEREELEKIYSKLTKKDVTFQSFDENGDFKAKNVSQKASYIERNKAMIDASDFCIFYYNENYLPPKRKNSARDINSYQPKSGTKIAYEYAVKNNKTIINLFKN